MPRREQGRRPLPDTAGWLEEVLFSFNHAVIVCDETGTVIFFNQAAEELTGLARARVLGRPCAKVFHDFPVANEMVRRVSRTGQNETRAEESFPRADRRVPVRVSCLAVPRPQHNVHGTALVIHDRSQQKALEEAARRNESLAQLGSIVAGLAHEIRNPLAGIKGAAQLLAQRLADEPDLEQYTTVIGREADRLSNLLEDLLTLGAPPKPSMTRLNVHRLIGHVTALVEPELKRRGLTLEGEFDPSLPDVLGDEEQLTQVLLNLFNNAMEAMSHEEARQSPHNRILIRTRMETDFRVRHGDRDPTRFLRIEIEDQGCGIAPQAASHLFEPFFTTKPRGTGLGLSIAYRIVAEHGGTMRAESVRPSGACIIVELPVVAPNEN